MLRYFCRYLRCCARFQRYYALKDAMRHAAAAIIVTRGGRYADYASLRLSLITLMHPGITIFSLPAPLILPLMLFRRCFSAPFRHAAVYAAAAPLLICTRRVAAAAIDACRRRCHIFSATPLMPCHAAIISLMFSPFHCHTPPPMLPRYYAGYFAIYDYATPPYACFSLRRLYATPCLQRYDAIFSLRHAACLYICCLRALPCLMMLLSYALHADDIAANRLRERYDMRHICARFCARAIFAATLRYFTPC